MIMIDTTLLDSPSTDLEAASKASKDDILITYSLGEAYYKAGRFAEARTQLEGVAKKDASGPSGKQAAEMLKHFPK